MHSHYRAKGKTEGSVKKDQLVEEIVIAIVLAGWAGKLVAEMLRDWLA
jgi:hypothetical protein